MSEKRITSELIYQGSILNVRKDIVKCSNSQESTREVVEHCDAVVIMPVTQSYELYLAYQFRYATNQTLLEFPAGKIDPGETPLAAAKRELKEETGLLANQWVSMGSSYASPGFCNEKYHFFIAQDLDQGDRKLDDDENIIVHKVSFKELWNQLKEQSLNDTKTIAGLFFVKEYLGL
ncbi:hypothetical protein DID75_00410 [Candidatus Marinamargulisbacteria bacterium SCGC AG-410-N11]|nr:hypothetical protein DID75_00410 [Candidatus Marinamargulisbacteria bacterium SCGC AG-410-N11]